MNDKATNGEVIVINLKLNGILLLLVIGLLVFLFLWGLLGLGYREAAANEFPLSNTALLSSNSMRKFYLTPSNYPSSQAVSICEEGYHFASLWELLDTTNLAYAQELGAVWQAGDLGSGPPSELPGWIRTGYESEADTGIPGRDNCNGWTTLDNGFDGTTAELRSDWTGTGGNYFHGWEVYVVDCSQEQGVWCVED
jgi:hypothetical protein